MCCFLPARNLKENTGVAWRREGTQVIKKTSHKKLGFVSEVAWIKAGSAS